jgi:hypothetical protein
MRFAKLGKILALRLFIPHLWNPLNLFFPYNMNIKPKKNQIT